MKDQYNHKYDDIINLPHPTSKKHPRMSLYARAAQFSPFAALTGHEAAIKETVRQTDAKQVLSEDLFNSAITSSLNTCFASVCLTVSLIAASCPVSAAKGENCAALV